MNSLIHLFIVGITSDFVAHETGCLAYKYSMRTNQVTVVNLSDSSEQLPTVSMYLLEP